MIQLFNQFSYLGAVLLIGIILIASIKRLPQLNRIMRVGVIAVYLMIAIVVGITYQYPASPVQAKTVTDVENVLINEQPTFVMLYSNY